jgi:hypothetical protein
MDQPWAILSEVKKLKGKKIYYLNQNNIDNSSKLTQQPNGWRARLRHNEAVR